MAENETPETIVEETIVEDTTENTVIENIQEVAEDVKETIVENTTNLLKGFDLAISSFAESVGQSEAVNLLRRSLKLKETGEVDDELVSAVDQVGDKRALLDDYHFARTDSPVMDYLNSLKKYL